MAFTEEQIVQLDFIVAQQNVISQTQITQENLRRENELFMDRRRVTLECIRLAKETLIESARYKSVDDRDISAANIVSFANELVSVIDSIE